MWYGADLSPQIYEYGLGEYIFEFDIKSNKSGRIAMYFQNGSDTEYVFNYYYIDTTTNYQKVSAKVTITKNGKSNATQSQLAFYGTYFTELYPTVKNLKVYKVLER